MAHENVSLSRRKFLALSATALASAALAACSSGTRTQTAIPSATPPPSAAPALPTTPSEAAATRAGIPSVSVPTTTVSAPPSAAASAITGTPAAASSVTTAPAVANTVPPDASPQFRAVAEKVMAEMAKAGVPGVSLGILADGREEYASFGVASIETKQPVTADTLFQIGSTTKTFTGTAIMRLVEQGKVDLNAPVRTYLPDFKVADADVSSRVTVKNLLTHSGDWWADLFADTGSGDDAIATFMATKMPTFPQLAPVGQYFSYNNTGFITAGRIIEVVLGKPYRAAMADLVLAPLGLTQSFLVPEEAMQRPYAVGHAKGAQGVQVQRPFLLPRNLEPAGGIFSNPRDLIKYARFHMGDGTVGGMHVLKAETLKMMQSPQGPKPIGLRNGDIGLPWLMQQFGSLHLIAHPGDTFGEHSEFVAAPDRGFAFVMLANAEPGGALLSALALNEALARYLGLGGAAVAQPTAVAATPTVVPTPTALPPEQLAQYAGRYAEPNGAFTFAVENGALMFRGMAIPLPDEIVPAITPDMTPKAAQLRFIAADVALVGDTPDASVPVFFVRKPDGTVGWLSVSLRLVPRQ